MRKFSEKNFYVSTEATWEPCEIPESKPDCISRSGSRYWYSRKGVVRHSDHWGYVASCTWYCSADCGFCPYPDFADLLSSVYRYANRWGHIDVRKPLPRGFCHIKGVTGLELGTRLRELKIPHVLALTGFIGEYQFWKPDFDGYVIPSRSRQKLMTLVKQESEQIYEDLKKRIERKRKRKK